MLNGKIFQPSILPTIAFMRRNVVGKRVREARKQAKPPITQKDLVVRLQVSVLSVDQPTISKIEQETRPVLDFEAVALAKALRVSVAWLLGEADN